MGHCLSIRTAQTFLTQLLSILCLDVYLAPYFYSLFMYQDENENEDENQSVGSFWNLCVTNEQNLQCIILLKAWFVRPRLYPERTKNFVLGFVFVFVLAHEQPIRPNTEGGYQIGGC